MAGKSKPASSKKSSSSSRASHGGKPAGSRSEKGMSTGAKVAIGAAGVAAVGAAAAGLAATESGRNLVRKAAGKAHDALETGRVAVKHAVRDVAHKAGIGKEASVEGTKKVGKPSAVPTVMPGLAGSSGLGGSSLGGSSMGTGLPSMSRQDGKHGGHSAFESRGGPKVSARVNQQDAMRSAVRGRSGHR